MVEYRINIWFGVAPQTSHDSLSGQPCSVRVTPLFWTDQSDDCGSNPHLGVTVPQFLLIFLDQKAVRLLLKVQAAALPHQLGKQDMNSTWVHGD